MPGPTSDIYHPRWGTVADAELLERALAEQVGIVSNLLGSAPEDIVNVAKGPRGKSFPMSLCERQLRILRFALRHTLESL